MAGAQPKIALLEAGGKWGRPSGRIPTNRILKPPSGQFPDFAENEHFCLELAAQLSLGAVRSRVMTFAGETAIVVDRFDRQRHRGIWPRVHQEDFCQALRVLPTRKYENEGGPGIADVIPLLREAAMKPEEDVERFLRAIALNRVLAATDAHARNFALLHGPHGVRLAPFHDILSLLPYADEKLPRVKLAMSIGTEYLVKRINRLSWSGLAKQSRVSERIVIRNVGQVLAMLPSALAAAREKLINAGLKTPVREALSQRVASRISRCTRIILSHEST